MKVYLKAVPFSFITQWVNDLLNLYLNLHARPSKHQFMKKPDYAWGFVGGIFLRNLLSNFMY